MIRPTTLLLVLAVLFAGGAIWWSHDGTAEAAPKAKAAADTCREDLARLKQELAQAREEARVARAEARDAQQQLDKVLKKEQARVKKVQEQIGSPVIDDLR